MVFNRIMRRGAFDIDANEPERCASLRLQHPMFSTSYGLENEAIFK
jgi:hypothetical protein